MFYPIIDLSELMPDTMVPGIEKMMGTDHKNRMGYFTRSANSFKNSDFMGMQNRELENRSLQENFECTKGNLPQNVIEHVFISYSYRGENLMLNGLDDSMEVNNGSWRP